MTAVYSDVEIAFLQGWIGVVYDRFGFCNGGVGRCKVREGRGVPGLWCRVPECLRDRSAEIVSMLAAELDGNGWLGNRDVKANVQTNGSGRYLIVERRAA